MKANIPESTKQRIVIIGGGFAGLSFIQNIPKDHFQVVLLDKHNFHQFQPLFYQVATAGLEPSSIVFPLRKVFQGRKDLHFRMCTVERIEAQKNTVCTSMGEIAYDFLIVASGATTNFFGNAEVESHAMPMKTISEALKIRNQVFSNFEKALMAETEEERQSFLNVIIVGGGPTGVEVAGTIAEMRRFILPRDYPEINFQTMSISLVEGSPRLLNGMSEKSGKKALKYLNQLGVKVTLNSIVENYNGEVVSLKSGEKLQTRNLIWAAGVKANFVDGIAEENRVAGNRMKVNDNLRVEGYENIYAVGDVALCLGDKAFPKGHPQVAQVAIQQAKFLAHLLAKKGKPGFVYKDLGAMATVGRNKAVVDLPNLHLSGFPAWAMWMLVHLRSILGVKNKILIFLDWLWNYFTYNLSLRLIIQPEEKKEKVKS